MSGTVENAADLPAGARDALRRHVLTLADSKRILGIRYSDWLLGAPSIETGIATSSMAQDEWGHARLLYAMLKDFDLDPVAVEHERDASEYASIGVLDAPFGDWAETIAGVVVVDGALTAALEGFSGGAYEQARARVPKMISEEDFHRDLGNAWFRRLSRGTDEARTRLRESVETYLPPALGWLDPGDEAAGELVDADLVAPGEELRARLLSRIGAVVSEAGVDVEAVAPDREGWDPERRRGPGEPDRDSVERARGDLNRALFVE